MFSLSVQAYELVVEGDGLSFKMIIVSITIKIRVDFPTRAFRTGIATLKVLILTEKAIATNLILAKIFLPHPLCF